VRLVFSSRAAAGTRKRVIGTHALRTGFVRTPEVQQRAAACSAPLKENTSHKSKIYTALSHLIVLLLVVLPIRRHLHALGPRGARRREAGPSCRAVPSPATPVSATGAGAAAGAAGSSVGERRAEAGAEAQAFLRLRIASRSVHPRSLCCLSPCAASSRCSHASSSGGNQTETEIMRS